MRYQRLIAAAAALYALAAPAGAQDWPTRAISLIVPFAAGGGVDVSARIQAQRMGELLGQSIVVENMGGAAGMTGALHVARSTPDGYTLLIGNSGTQAYSQALYKAPLYNAVTDFTPVALIADVPIVLIVRKDLPVNNFKEFVAYAKANAAKMQFGSAGAGSATHLGCVVLNTAMGTDIVHVPYKGTGPAMQDLIGGRIDFLCEIISTAKSQIDGGSVKALAIMTKDRSPVEPNLPTALEQGLDVQAYTWKALYLPKGAPADVVKKLNEAAVAAMTTPAVHDRLQSLGAMIVAPERRTPEYLGKFTADEIKKWEAPIKASGVSQ